MSLVCSRAMSFTELELSIYRVTDHMVAILEFEQVRGEVGYE